MLEVGLLSPISAELKSAAAARMKSMPEPSRGVTGRQVEVDCAQKLPELLIADRSPQWFVPLLCG